MKNNLREIRLREYMYSIKDMANKLGVPVSTYGSWEKDASRPHLELAFQIAVQLNKRVDEIWYLI